MAQHPKWSLKYINYILLLLKIFFQILHTFQVQHILLVLACKVVFVATLTSYCQLVHCYPHWFLWSNWQAHAASGPLSCCFLYPNPWSCPFPSHRSQFTNPIYSNLSWLLNWKETPHHSLLCHFILIISPASITVQKTCLVSLHWLDLTPLWAFGFVCLLVAVSGEYLKYSKSLLLNKGMNEWLLSERGWKFRTKRKYQTLNK